MFFIRLKPVPLQEQPQFILKRYRRVMFHLILNVLLHGWYLRMTDGERGISRLPPEWNLRKILMGPMRRMRFDPANHLGNGLS